MNGWMGGWMGPKTHASHLIRVVSRVSREERIDYDYEDENEDDEETPTVHRLLPTVHLASI